MSHLAPVVQNGATQQRAQAGDTHFFPGSLMVGGTAVPVERLEVDGVLAFQAQGSAPSASVGYGKVYVKADKKLYFKDEDGTEVDLSSSFTVGDALSGGTPGSVLFVGAGPSLAQDNANFFWDNTNKRLGVGTAVPGAVTHIAGGTLLDTISALKVAATLPTTPTTAAIGVFLDITSAGSAAQDQRALHVALNAGYTGSTSNSYAILGNNASSMGSTSAPVGNPTTFSSAVGVFGHAFGVNAGNRVGTFSTGETGTTNNIGSFNIGYVKTGMTGKAYGAIGVVSAQSTQSATGYGGYFYLDNGAGTVTAAGSAALVADNRAVAANIFEAKDNGSTILTIGDVASSDVVSVAVGTLLTSKKALSIAATLPASSTSETGIGITITTAGSDANHIPRGGFTQLAAGYTGTNATIGWLSINTTAGTGTSLFDINNFFGKANYGLHGSSQAATAGHNVGVVGLAENSSSLNIGVLGKAYNTATSGQMAGVVGAAINASGVTNRTAGLFFLTDNLSQYTPTIVSTALLTDNGNVAAPVQIWRDNGTIVGQVADGGLFGIGPNTPTHFLDVNVGILGNSVQALKVTSTLSATPSGSRAGVVFDITSAGAAANSEYGASINFNAGYTGTAATYGLSVTSTAAGTGTGDPFSGDASIANNVGAWGEAIGNVAATNVGAMFTAALGSKNYGFVGNAGNSVLSNNGFRQDSKNFGILGAVTLAKNAASTSEVHVGVAGAALNGDTNVAGWFGLGAATPTLTTSAALIADNVASGAIVFDARVNGTSALQVTGTGNVTIQSNAQIFQVRSAGQGHVAVDVGNAFTSWSAAPTHTLRFRYARSDKNNNTTVSPLPTYDDGIYIGTGRTTGGTISMDVFTPSTAVNTAHLTVVDKFAPTASSPNFAAVQITPEINGTSSGKATALAIASRTNTLTGGSVTLLDVGTTTTDYFTGYTSMFSVLASGFARTKDGEAITGTVTASKPADTSRNTTTTPTADPDLVLTLAVGTYLIETHLSFSGNGSDVGGVQTAWGGTATFTDFVASTITYNGSAKTVVEASRSNTFSGAPATAQTYLVATRAWLVVTVAGTLSVLWAQSVSDATNLTLIRGSFVTAKRIA